MKKRIYGGMLLLTTTGLVVVSLALCWMFYLQFSKSVREDLREGIRVFGNSSSNFAENTLAALSSFDMRVTIVDPDGTVVFDNAFPINLLANHLDREEIQEALALGYGESNRYSDTFGQETYYASVRLIDGYVLRAAKTTHSIWGMFAEALPTVGFMVLLIVVGGYALASRLTLWIVAPINQMDLSSPTAPYDELAPLIQTIENQRIHIAEQLASLNARTDTMTAIMDNMREGIILIDKRGLILTLNQSAATIFDIPGHMEGKNVLELTRDTAILHAVRSALDGIWGEITVERDYRMYHAIFSPVQGSGAMLLLWDNTEKMLGEKMRSEFSANVSHELKTPLTTIYGHAEMLAGGMVKPSDAGTFYARIKDEAARLITLIEDILLLSSLDEDVVQHHSEPVRFAEVAQEAIASLEEKASEHNVAVNLRGANFVMNANRAQIFELFHNLIDNAIKYNQPGGSIDILIEAEPQVKTARVVVTDTGIGIPREAQNRVFERFFRVDKSRSKKTGGTGLGLAIVKHIVIVHHGTIELTSMPGEGTMITITFPTC